MGRTTKIRPENIMTGAMGERKERYRGFFCALAVVANKTKILRHRNPTSISSDTLRFQRTSLVACPASPGRGDNRELDTIELALVPQVRTLDQSSEPPHPLRPTSLSLAPLD